MKLRKKKYVRSDVQLSLTLMHVAVTLMALTFQFLAVLYAMMGRGAPEGAGLESANDWILSGLTQAFLWTVVVVLPATVVAAILTSHKIAGPIHRFRLFLEEVARGESPSDLRLRAGDKLQDIGVLLNDVTRPLRGGGGTETDERAEAERAA